MTGLWHGASWNFVVWGMWHGLFIVLEKIIPIEKFLRWRPIQMVYTLLIVICGWVFFRAETLSYAVDFLHRMFVPYNIDEVTVLWNREFQIVLIAALLCCGIVSGLFKIIPLRESLKQKIIQLGTPLVCIFSAYLSLLMLANNTYNPFIYFRF